MYGIEESLPNTSKAERQLRDLENITSAFCNAALPIEASSIRDCFRLGKYKLHAPRPRPILIKFLRSTEATMALSKVKHLSILNQTSLEKKEISKVSSLKSGGH